MDKDIVLSTDILTIKQSKLSITVYMLLSFTMNGKHRECIKNWTMGADKTGQPANNILNIHCRFCIQYIQILTT